MIANTENKCTLYHRRLGPTRSIRSCYPVVGRKEKIRARQASTTRKKGRLSRFFGFTGRSLNVAKATWSERNSYILIHKNPSKFLDVICEKMSFLTQGVFLLVPPSMKGWGEKGKIKWRELFPPGQGETVLVLNFLCHGHFWGGPVLIFP